MEKDIHSVLDEASEWLEIDGVVSVGRGEAGGPEYILVGTSRRAEEIRELLPSDLHGYRIQVELLGRGRPE